MVVLDEKIPHSRNTRDGTMIKLNVNSGMYTMDMWICSDGQVRFFQLAGTVSGETAFDKSVTLAAMCGGVRIGEQLVERS